MKNDVFVIYDTVSCRYGNVFASPNLATATLDITRSVQNQKDFDLSSIELCSIGSIDVETGVLEPCAPVRHSLVAKSSAVPISDIEKKMT